jgi:hypothetical protein
MVQKKIYLKEMIKNYFLINFFTTIFKINIFKKYFFYLKSQYLIKSYKTQI